MKELGGEIAAEYDGREPILVASLTTAIVFLADLSRALPIVHNLDFVELAGYDANGGGGGRVRLLKDLAMSIEGRDVLLVEDIVDSGLTLSYLLKNLRTRRPASLEVCALLQKMDVQQVALDIRYRGFEIPPVFVVGYGLDHAERYRNLPFVATLKPAAYGAPAS